jgi:thiamine-monophosphate kinase
METKTGGYTRRQLMSETKSIAGKRLKPGETGLLERIRNTSSRGGLRNSGLRLAIGDDAALFKGSRGSAQILTCDWFLEGTHFLRGRHPPDAVGWKCLARAVSDVAAMGGVPRCFLLSLALPGTHAGFWLDQFLRGLRRAARRFGCMLAGGDTTRRQNILINVTVVGEVRSGWAVLRSQARPRDIVFLSGRLGEAELGLRLLRKGKGRIDSRDLLLQKHLYPEPRLALGRWLAEKRLASAMMDLSDGLSSDLPRLCAASGVGARIEMSKIPAVRVPHGLGTRSHDPLELALHGGDDYELLFTVRQRKWKHIPRSFHGIPITAIGEITRKRTLQLVDRSGCEVPLPNRGWDPFRSPH